MKTVQNILIFAVFAVVTILAIPSWQGKADAQPVQKQRASIILFYQSVYAPGQNMPHEVVVVCGSRSQFAPVIQPGTSLAEALATCLNEGMSLQPPVSYGQYLLVR